MKQNVHKYDQRRQIFCSGAFVIFLEPKYLTLFLKDMRSFSILQRPRQRLRQRPRHQLRLRLRQRLRLADR